MLETEKGRKEEQIGQQITLLLNDYEEALSMNEKQDATYDSIKLALKERSLLLERVCIN